MKYVIQHNDKLETLEVVLKGKPSGRERKAILVKLSYLLASNSAKCLLMDITQTESPDEQDMEAAMEMVLHMRLVKFPVHTRIAFVYREMDALLQNFKTVTQCDGYQLNTFKNRAKAEKWLSKA